MLTAMHCLLCTVIWAEPDPFSVADRQLEATTYCTVLVQCQGPVHPDLQGEGGKL